MRTWYSTDQEAIDGAFGAFFAAESPIEAVRAAAPAGFDSRLWASLADMGGAGMVLPEPRGGGASLADLAVVARQLGRHLAPVPLIEHSVACRLLTAASESGTDLEALLGELAGGGTIATLTLRPVVGGRARLVPAGAVAGAVVGFDGADLVLDLSAPPAETVPNTADLALADQSAASAPSTSGAAVPNTADLPLADRSAASAPSISGAAVPNTADLPLVDRDLTAAAVVASGPTAARLWAAARAEWQALMAAACAGLAARAIEIGVDYVMGRRQFGVPVGSFQAVQHGLADAAVRTEGGRLLAHRAAWALDAGQPDGRRLAAMALVFCAEAARFAADRSLQYHGGYGYSAEYDVQLYYRRAAGWPLQIGEPAGLVAELADIDLGPRTAAGTEAAVGTEAEGETGTEASAKARTGPETAAGVSAAAGLETAAGVSAAAGLETAAGVSAAAGPETAAGAGVGAAG